MIALAMPVGSAHGWGICGKYISREMAALLAAGHPSRQIIRLISQPFNLEMIGDELEFQAIAALAMKQEEASQFKVENGITRLNGPLLVAIVDRQMTSWAPSLRGTRTVGYTFFEENLLQPSWIENARRNFDLIATGSSWCTEILQRFGLQNVQTVIQGVDSRLFFPWPANNATPEREYLKDRFVIFSGGKFELRKGQDIVIRAVKIQQDRHPDVVLVNAWFNAWQQSIDTMKLSKHLRWPTASGPYVDTMNRLLAENGIDLSRTVTLTPRANALMPRIYRNSDIGLFPNRCEGGTNLVLMEYMACGKPAVATASTGHADLVRPENALIIGIKGEIQFTDAAGPLATWPEPDLDDTVDKLQWAYQHRDQAAVLGRRAGADLAGCTWTDAAGKFLTLLTQ